MIRKPFEQLEYNNCNDVAIKAVISKLIKNGWKIIKKSEDFNIDIIAIKNKKITYHEVEIKKLWNLNWPKNWNTVHIPERKLRFAKPNYWFWILKSDLSEAWIIDGKLVQQYPIVEVSNYKILTGEMFINIPINACKKIIL